MSEAGEAVCWGGFEDDEESSAPPGRYVGISHGGAYVCAVTEDGEPVCWGGSWGWVADEEGKPDLTGRVVAIATGQGSEDSTCALLDNGRVTCWSLYFGGRTIVRRSGNYTAITGGSGHNCVLTGAGEVDCWGANSYGQSDAPPGQFIAISASEARTCAITVSGEVVCWGETRYTKRMGRL